ncbi:hypothetical protein CR513_15136, partial [Mucuna pruriens]
MTNPIPDKEATLTPLAPPEEPPILQNIMQEISEIWKQVTTESEMEIEIQDARSVEVTNRHSKLIRPTPEAPHRPPYRKGGGMHLDKYEGTTNSDENLTNYLTQVNLFNNEDAILCWIFPTSLKESALHWYMQLPANSIDSFRR